MKVLVIGGSYFLGRVFTMIAHKQCSLTLINRGQYSMKHLDVQEYHFDRHDISAWKQLPHESYDAVVDFCGYQQGDIKQVIENYPGNIKHYIFVSTVDVYQRQTGKIKDETHPLETRRFLGEVGDYIYQKVILEQELIDVCKKHKIAYTSIRPGTIYGPFNYAPRESLLIQSMVKKEPFIHPMDANASFQLTYVKDVAEAILLTILKKAYYKTYNVVAPEIIQYKDLYQCFNSCINQQHPIIDQTIEQALSQNYPFPYPLTKEEQELYDGSTICKDLDFHYTPLQEGIQKTYQAFLPIFQNLDQ